MGPKSTTVPQAGLDTTARAGPLAQLIVQQIITTKADPETQLLYNPIQWRDANGTTFSADTNWLQPPVDRVINGRADAFGERCALVDQAHEFHFVDTCIMVGWVRSVNPKDFRRHLLMSPSSTPRKLLSCPTAGKFGIHYYLRYLFLLTAGHMELSGVPAHAPSSVYVQEVCVQHQKGH